jgi:hypothetical protein
MNSASIFITLIYCLVIFVQGLILTGLYSNILKRLSRIEKTLYEERY